jgi:hypothetical protein
MQLDFFNTNQTPEPQLSERRNAAITQQDMILEIFRRNQMMTPSRCHHIYHQYGRKAPITSIRRAITNLASQGFLIKTKETAPGPYGQAEHFYKLNK